MIVPSIDLQGGRVVQLVQGERVALERSDAETLARTFGRFGEVAVIDLDGARGQGHQREIIRRLCALAECRVGGGIRDVDTAVEWIRAGAVRVIVGTRVFRDGDVDTAFLQTLARRIGRSRIIVAVDARGDTVVTHAWRKSTGMTVPEAIRKLEPYVGGFLYTDVEREGLLQGVHLDRIAAVVRATDRRVTVAGGVTTLEDVRAITRMGAEVQIGMAIYTGRIDLGEAFIAALDWEKGYIPTIVVDTAGRVRMLAYSTPESLRQTFATGQVWFYSRSRKTLWHKGATSGHVLYWQRVRMDCDRDTILVVAEPAGPVCHREDATCFGDVSFRWEDLFAVVRDRLQHPRPGSYTASLTPDRVRAKILEEAREVVDAATAEDIVWEVADLLYFLTVLLAQTECTPADVLRELHRRRWR